MFEPTIVPCAMPLSTLWTQDRCVLCEDLRKKYLKPRKTVTYDVRVFRIQVKQKNELNFVENLRFLPLAVLLKARYRLTTIQDLCPSFASYDRDLAKK